MKNVDNLLDVKVGDVFVVSSRYGSGKRAVLCTKVTPARAIIGGHQYTKKDGRPFGASDKIWDRAPYLKIAAPEILEEIKLQETIRNARRFIADNLEKISDELVLEIYQKHLEQVKGNDEDRRKYRCDKI